MKKTIYKTLFLFCIASTFTACTTDSIKESDRTEINLKTKPIIDDYTSALEGLYGTSYSIRSLYRIIDEDSTYSITEVFADGASEASGYFIDIPEEDNLVFVSVDRVNLTFQVFDNLNNSQDIFDMTQDPEFSSDFTPVTFDSEARPKRKFWGKVTETRTDYSGNGCYTTYVRVTKYVLGKMVSTSGWVPQGTDCP